MPTFRGEVTSGFGIEKDPDQEEQKEKKRSSFYERLQAKKQESPASTPKSDKKRGSLSERFKASRKKAEEGDHGTSKPPSLRDAAK